METKKELEEKIAELEAKLNEQKHLADAVNAKDEEISKIKEENLKNVNQLTEKNLKIQALEKEKALRGSIEEKENTIKKLIHALQGYQNAYRSFLKNVQGGLENAVELEALLSEQLK
jgi:septal ring factor EnvC (AmiA/AmiB activator)